MREVAIVDGVAYCFEFWTDGYFADEGYSEYANQDRAPDEESQWYRNGYWFIAQMYPAKINNLTSDGSVNAGILIFQTKQIYEIDYDPSDKVQFYGVEESPIDRTIDCYPLVGNNIKFTLLRETFVKFIESCKCQAKIGKRLRIHKRLLPFVCNKCNNESTIRRFRVDSDNEQQFDTDRKRYVVCSSCKSETKRKLKYAECEAELEVVAKRLKSLEHENYIDSSDDDDEKQ